MGRVLPVTKSFKSLIPRKNKKTDRVMNKFECLVCGNERFDEFCPHCKAYHAPQKCEGEGCKICAEIKFIKEHSKKEFVLNKKNSLLSPPG